MLHQPIEMMTIGMAIDPCGDPCPHRMTQEPGNPAGQQQCRDLYDIGP